MLNGRTELHVFNRGSVNGDSCCKEVILPIVHLFCGAIGSDFVFTDDNARPNQTDDIQHLMEREDIILMDVSVLPNLNPIEHV
ncbi:transposable element Tc3 transposase [Trichonephila clavipes]|nr:transposable element Tc3 transposase [Trichonephila clavipes]